MVNNKKPFVTYHVNTFNRVHLLRNMLLSFEACNTYENFEWVIMDYGSTDNSRDFIFDFMKSRDYVSAVFGNEQKYFDILGEKGLRPPTKNKQAHSIFGTSRNVARIVGKGDIFIDIADDHQFIRKCNWVQEMLDIIEQRKALVGENDISSIIYRGLSHTRIMKPNNIRYPEEITESKVPYFRCIEKRYDDYHLTTRDMYNKIGSYLQIENETDATRIEHWKQGLDTFCHYTDYLERSKKMNLQKVFMKFPCAIDFPNYVHEKLNKPTEGLIAPLIPTERMVSIFGDLDRPVSSDEILNISTQLYKGD